MEGVRDRERREGRLAPSGWTKEHSCLEGANKEGLGDALSRHGVAYGTEHTHSYIEGCASKEKQLSDSIYDLENIVRAKMFVYSKEIDK
jgi:hypothetical protein